MPSLAAPENLNSRLQPPQTQMPQTVACQLTATGRGAIAVVAVHGEQAHQAVLANFRPASPLLQDHFPPLEIRYGCWLGNKQTTGGAEVGESVVVTALSRQSVEIHCHGGKAAVAAILKDLSLAGVCTIPQAQFDSSIGVQPQTTAMKQILQETNTTTTAAIVLNQLRGKLANKCRDIIQQLQSPQTACTNSAPGTNSADSELAKLQSFIPAAQHLTTPWKVVIAGPPNVGKSSLINRLLGYKRAITFDAPGTTRDVVVADTAINGWPIQLSDTAGIRGGDDPIESEGVRRALKAIEEADLLLLVVDANAELTPVHQTLAQNSSQKIILAWNKIDLTANQQHPAQTFPNTSAAQPTAQVAISAKTGFGIELLQQEIMHALMPSCPTTEDAVPVTEHQITTIKDVARCDDPTKQIELLSQLL